MSRADGNGVVLRESLAEFEGRSVEERTEIRTEGRIPFLDLRARREIADYPGARFGFYA